MTNQVNSLLITPTLLNSWGYINWCSVNVRENENDAVCVEDKITQKQEEVYQDFLKVLNREQMPTTDAMQRGIDFENECYTNPNNVVYPVIKGGCFQLVGKKKVSINIDDEEFNFLMYGRLDVLKGGVIYDIKRVSKYSPPKYSKSYQHKFYLDLFDKAYKFQYLVYDGNILHYETYYPEQCLSTKEVIKEFIRFLKEKNILNIYLEKWRTK